MEQALPLRANWLNFNRFRARAEHTLPLGRKGYRLLLCGKGAPPAGPGSSLLYMVLQSKWSAAVLGAGALLQMRCWKRFNIGLSTQSPLHIFLIVLSGHSKYV